MKIETFEMMRMQCLYDREVEFDLSETTVLPLRVSELLDGTDDVERFISNELRYPESKGSQLFRERIEELGIRFDYLTCTPSLLSDHLGTIVMEPQRRESILARTRHIIRKNLPLIEEWFLKRDDIFTYVRPEAGAFVYCEYKLPINSAELINRLIAEKSVLLAPGDHFGLDRGIRVGFGCDVEKSLEGLARTEALMHAMK